VEIRSARERTGRDLATGWIALEYRGGKVTYREENKGKGHYNTGKGKMNNVEKMWDQREKGGALDVVPRSGAKKND